ncbi:MAG: dihydropteroate synthase [Planctomycetota bacterium]
MSFFEALRRRPHALVMGVLNVTPDSFSDGGVHVEPGRAVEAAHGMIAAGAAIVDIGGESTRPGASPVTSDEEWERVAPVLQRLRDVPVSIDTRHASIAQRALDAGAALVNDVSGGADPAMLPLVAERGAGICLMHMRGEPGTMQADPQYDDVVGEVEAYLLERAQAAERAGIPAHRVLIDPGIGFGKTLDHNLALLRALPRFARHGYALLVGVSRKRFLGAITGRAVEQRGDATTAAVTLSAAAGAAIVRVHDVGAAVDSVSVAAAWNS